MKLTVMPVLVEFFRTVHKDLEKKLRELEMRGRIYTICTTAMLRFAKILKKVL